MTWYVGIDLGTTNSAIASYNGEVLRLHKSPEQHDVTPSALYFDRRGAKFIGQRAYDSAAHSPNNAALNFKRLMGSATRVSVTGAGLVLSPEECSAQLLAGIAAYVPEDIRSAGIGGTVVTVPAAFDQVQKEATMRAAEMAGLGTVALMQEPVAAVMSVVRARSEDGRFVVYDLGGGTLDIAVAESIAGRVTLLAHGGIAMCGGRDFDRLILDRIVAPWLRQTFDLPPDALEAGKGFDRVLTWAIERAKIELSARDQSVVSLSEAECRRTDRTGSEIYVDVALVRAQLNQLMEPNVLASIDATQATLKQAGLRPSDVDRIIFVGGPTQYRPLRDRVSTALGIPVTTDINPMTAVAEGAAVFAESIDWASASRSRKAARGTARSTGERPVEFAYTARTPGQAGRIMARIAGPPPDAEFQVDCLDTGWSSGRLRLADGVSVEVPLAKPGDNSFKVFVFSQDGGLLAAQNTHIVIARTAATVEAIPSSHSIGVETLEKIGGRPTLSYLVRAGDALPKKGRMVFKAAESLAAGSASSLNFKLWEGDISSPVTDNRYIGVVKVSGVDFEEGVIAAGADLECDFEVLDSGAIRVAVTVPSVSATFNSDRNFYSPQEGQLDLTVASRHIAEQGQELVARMDTVAATVQDTRVATARAEADRAAALDASVTDPEACKAALDAVMHARRLLADIRQSHLAAIRGAELELLQRRNDEVIRQYAKPSEVSALEGLFASASRVTGRSTGDFESYASEIRSLQWGVLWRQDWFVVDRFRSLIDAPHRFVDQQQLETLTAMGKQAIEADDVGRLRTIVAELFHQQIGWGRTEDMGLSANIVRG